MLIKNITFFLLTLLSYNVIAADAIMSKRLNFELKKCVAVAPNSVVKTLECFAENTGLWNSEINARIQTRMSSQSAEKNSALEQDQSNWEKLRDAKTTYFENVIAINPTSQQIINFANEELQIVKNRALSL